MFAVDDMYTGQWEIHVILTFPENQIDVESLQPGHTIAILYSERSFCLGENVVVRVRDPAKIKVIRLSSESRILRHMICCRSSHVISIHCYR